MNFGDYLNRKGEVEKLIKASLVKAEKDVEWDVLNLIPDPFNGKDALSCVYRAFKSETNIPVALPVFSLFAYISSYLIKNNSRIRVPKMADPLEADLWLISLAPSGSSKTFSKKNIESSIPFEQVVLSEPAGAAAFVEELQEKNRGLYFQDECAQVLKQIEQAGGPLAELKKYLLLAYDHQKISRKTKKDELVVEKPVLTLLWLNTIDSFVKTITEESLSDGFSQRFLYVISNREVDKEMEDFPTYDTKAIKDMIHAPIERLFSETPFDFYDISQEAFEVYEQGFKFISRNHFNQSINESFYRRALFSAYKYAVIYHLLLGKEGNVIDATDMSMALKVCLFHLYSLKNLLDYKNNGYEEEVEKRKKIVSKVKAIKAECEAKKIDITPRLLQRKVSAIKTAEQATYYIDLVSKKAA